MVIKILYYNQLTQLTGASMKSISSLWRNAQRARIAFVGIDLPGRCMGLALYWISKVFASFGKNKGNIEIAARRPVFVEPFIKPPALLIPAVTFSIHLTQDSYGFCHPFP